MMWRGRVMGGRGQRKFWGWRCRFNNYRGYRAGKHWGRRCYCRKRDRGDKVGRRGSRSG